jgi:hypothetical protein
MFIILVNHQIPKSLNCTKVRKKNFWTIKNSKRKNYKQKKMPKDANFFIIKKTHSLKSKVILNVKVQIFNFTKWDTFKIPISIATKCDKKSQKWKWKSKKLKFYLIYTKNTHCIIDVFFGFFHQIDSMKKKIKIN